MRAENIVLLKEMNTLFSSLQLPLIPTSATTIGGGGGGDDADEGNEAGAGGDEDEMALLAELAAMRGSGGSVTAWEDANASSDSGGVQGMGRRDLYGDDNVEPGMMEVEPSSTEPSDSAESDKNK